MSQQAKITYKVKLQGSDGRDYIESFEGLRKDLDATRDSMERMGWNDVARNLRDDLEAIKQAILTEILIPKAKIELIAYLKGHPNIESRIFYEVGYKKQGLYRIAWTHAQDELLREGKIEFLKQPRGKNRKWRIKS